MPAEQAAGRWVVRLLAPVGWLRASADALAVFQQEHAGGQVVMVSYNPSPFQLHRCVLCWFEG